MSWFLFYYMCVFYAYHCSLSRELFLCDVRQKGAKAAGEGGDSASNGEVRALLSLKESAGF